MQQAYATISANWMIWCVPKDDVFMMFGSRKINRLNLEVDYLNNDDFNFFDGGYKPLGFFSHPEYNVKGSLRGFTVVTGKTELEALAALLHAFQEEERCEKAEAEEAVQRAKELKKIQKAHKKAIKQAKEGKFDAVKCTEDCIYCSTYDGFIYDDLNEYDASWQDEAEEY